MQQCGHSTSHPTRITGETIQAWEMVEVPRKFIVLWGILSSCWVFAWQSLSAADVAHRTRPQIFILDGMATMSHALCKNHIMLVLPAFPNTRCCFSQCKTSFCFNWGGVGGRGNVAFNLLISHPSSSLTFPTFPQSWPGWQHKDTKKLTVDKFNPGQRNGRFPSTSAKI